MVSLQANIISCFYIWIFFFQVRMEGKVFLWRHLRDKTCLSLQAHPKSSLSKNELSCNDSLLNFIVSSLNIVLFGIRNYFQKCMNEGGSFLTGSSLDINPTEIWRRCFFFFFFEASSLSVSRGNVWGVFFCSVSWIITHWMVIYFSFKLVAPLRLTLIIVTCSECHPHTLTICTLQTWIITSRWELLSW